MNLKKKRKKGQAVRNRKAERRKTYGEICVVLKETNENGRQ